MCELCSLPGAICGGESIGVLILGAFAEPSCRGCVPALHRRMQYQAAAPLN